MSLVCSIGMQAVLSAAQNPAPPPAGTPGQAAASEPAYTTQQALDYARRWRERGEFDNAIGWYSDILLRQPDNGPALFGYAETLRQQGRNTEAKMRYEEYVRGPGRDDPKGYYGLALTLQPSEWHAVAINHLRHALQLNPNYVEAMTALAVSLRAKRQLPEARRYAEEAVQRAPNDHQARRVLAVILADMGEFENATRQMNAALQIVRDAIQADPSDPSQLPRLQEYYGSLQELLQHRLASEGESVAVLNALSVAIQDRAHVEHTLRLYDALQVAMRAAELAPRSVETLLNLADLQEQLRLPADAARTYHDILAIDPNQAIAKERARHLPAPSTQPTASAPTTQRAP